MKELDIDILAMPETNTSWTREVQRECQRYRNMVCGNFRNIGMSSDKVSIGKYKPGGVALFSRGRIVGRINKSGVDPKGLGQWCYHHLSTKGDHHIWIIAGYR
eukprot:12437544-Ditylum_brightwellii.AAC.1